MADCPVCGNRLKYVRGLRTYICEKCGFQGSLDDVFRLREEKRKRREDLKEEYLRWWLSRDKK